MGAAESKLRFKNHVFRLTDSTRQIPINSEYWETFWKEPQSSNDIFNLLTPSDIRTIRDTNREHFVRLIRVVAGQLLYLAGQRALPIREFPQQNLLNCIRLLTKLLPFMFEEPELVDQEKELFWTAEQSEDQQASLPLGAKLVFACVDLLFTAGFTVPRGKSELANKVDLAIWEPGIGLNGKFQQPRVDFDSNRLDVLRLLLVLCSQCLYETQQQLVSSGSRYLTVLTTSLPKMKLLTLICSLLNLSCRSLGDGDSGLESPNQTFVQLRVLVVTHAIQLLTLMIVYPVPKADVAFLKETGINTETPFNLARHFCGKIHKETELEFLKNGLLGPLQSPLLAASEGGVGLLSSFVNSAFNQNNPLVWSVESIMLVWEFYQLNRRFRAYIATKHGASLMVSLLYYVHTYRKQEAYRNLVRICAYFFLYLSADPVICTALLETFPFDDYSAYPQNFKISVAPKTYRDFLVTHTAMMLLDFSTIVLRPTLVEWMYNLVPLGIPANDNVPMMNRRASRDNVLVSSSSAPPAASIVTQQREGGGISYHTATILTQLVVRFSTTGFLQDNSINPDLLALILRAICHALCRFPQSSSVLIFVLCRDRKHYKEIMTSIGHLDNIRRESLRSSVALEDPESDFSLSDSRGSIASGEAHEEDEDSFMRPRPPAGMSAKAKGKAVAGAPLQKTWPGSHAFNIILEFIDRTLERVQGFETGADSASLVSQIEKLDYSDLVVSHIHRGEFLPSKTGFEPLKFTWSNMSLGWYSSILWGTIFVNSDVNRRKRYSVSGSISVFKKAAIDWGLSKWSNSEAQLVETAENAMSDVGTWHGTHVKVFKIKERGRDAPSFMQPRGAVDAVADSLVKRLSDFRLGRNSVSDAPPGTPDSASFFRNHNPFGAEPTVAPDSPRGITITPRGSVSSTPRGSVVGTPVLAPRQSFT